MGFFGSVDRTGVAGQKKLRHHGRLSLPAQLDLYSHVWGQSPSSFREKRASQKYSCSSVSSAASGFIRSSHTVLNCTVCRPPPCLLSSHRCSDASLHDDRG